MKISTFAFAAALLLPAAASAQEVLHFEGVKTAGGDKVGGASTGAYLASRGPSYISKFDIYCLDYDHTAQTVWTSHSVTFSEAVGVNLVQTQRQLGTEKTITIQKLRAAAYLSAQFALTPVGLGASDDTWDTIHGAIWSLFSTNANVNQAAMLTMATDAVNNHGNETQWDNYVLMLDQQTFSANYSTSMTLNQAFITYDPPNTTTTVTPEPATYALMGAGLFAIGFVRRKRLQA